MNHTPGPWKALRMGHEQIKGWYVRSDDSVHITGWGSVTQTEANARLIAAAPLMLKELEAIEWVEMGTTEDEKPYIICPSCQHENVHNVDCRLKAAIAAAKPEVEG